MGKKATIFKREPITELEDLRDDCIAVVLNSKQTFKQVHERGGPTPQTIGKWLYRETKFPQLATIRAILKACDFDLTVAASGEVEPRRHSYEGISYPRPEKAARKTNKPKNKTRDRTSFRTVRKSVERKVRQSEV